VADGAEGRGCWVASCATPLKAKEMLKKRTEMVRI